ncbi:MAG: class I SAM-dependent methyltransferase [Cyanobacteria bacterium P01_D01_bin.50]
MEITFLNYGYVDLNSHEKQLELKDSEQNEVYCAQLYHHVASFIPLNTLDVLEIGCGRGGGSSYIQRYLHPQTMTGVDLSENNIKFCQKQHIVPHLKFCVGDAESLQFPDCSFDAVVNVESSHCYPSIEKFFAEVFRVLRPNGHFLYTDFRPKTEINNIKEQLELSGFKILKSEIITENVIKAMDIENERKLATIAQNFPKYLQEIGTWFAACQGTPIYEGFKNGDAEYFYYALQK